MIEESIKLFLTAIEKKGKVTFLPFTVKIENPMASEDTKINNVGFSLTLYRPQQ
jgi:hypothetical protein